MKSHWLDRITAGVAPVWTLKRRRSRVALDMLSRHYEAASVGRRTGGWRRSSGDANAVIGPALTVLREHARDLVRNNPYAESALSTIVDHTVGWGIVATPKDARALEAWERWADSTDCDADGRHDFYGLQKLVMRTVVESGEVLVRRRFRRPEDGFSLPLQLQVLDPDFMDSTRDQERLPNGGRIVQGVEYDAIGRRVAYWLFREHPGALTSHWTASDRVPAENITHVFRPLRPGQVRGPSWFAPVLLRSREFDEYEDATLMKAKIAACLAVLTTDPSGSMASLGHDKDDTKTPPVDMLEPGAVLNLPPGRSVEIVQPPQAREYSDYAKNHLRAIATGLGVTYEDISGDYQDMPFSAARMSRLRHWSRVEDWRWRILIPQFCVPAWRWAMDVAAVFGQVSEMPGVVEWTTPPAPMVDPVNEGLAYQRNIRSGLMSQSEALRERGYNPRTVFEEMAADNRELDRLELVLDSDPRKMTQAGQRQSDPPPPAPADNEIERAAVRVFARR